MNDWSSLLSDRAAKIVDPFDLEILKEREIPDFPPPLVIELQRGAIYRLNDKEDYVSRLLQFVDAVPAYNDQHFIFRSVLGGWTTAITPAQLKGCDLKLEAPAKLRDDLPICQKCGRYPRLATFHQGYGCSTMAILGCSCGRRVSAGPTSLPRAVELAAKRWKALNKASATLFRFKNQAVLSKAKVYTTYSIIGR